MMKNTTGRFWLLAVAAASFVFSNGRAEDKEFVKLTVAEPAGLARDNEPVTTGVPFAPGVLAKDVALALTDAAGKTVPLQTRVLQYWPDGSVKWVLLDFQASVEANQSAAFNLAAGPAKVATPPQAIKVRDNADALVVDTGSAEFALNKKKFDLFTAVKVDGKDVLGDKSGLVITDLAGKQRTGTSDLAEGYKLEVVESGPMRTVVRALGQMQATEKLQIGFTCWYHFYAGSKNVRVFFTMRNLAGQAMTQTDQASVRDGNYHDDIAKLPGNVEVKSVELVLATAKRGGAAALIGGDGQAHEISDGKIYQDSSAGWIWQAGDGNIVDPLLKANKEWMDANAPPEAKGKPFFEFDKGLYDGLTDKKRLVGCSFRGYRVYDQAGQETARGDRCPGWVHSGQANVGIRWFWQMYPKAIEVKTDGTVTLGLWPKEWSRSHVFEGHIHKTHELLFAFGQPADAKQAAACYTRFDRRLLAVAPNAYYGSSLAFNGPLMPENRKEYARFEDWALCAVQPLVNKNPGVAPALASCMYVERERQDNYGVFHFGDTSKRGFRGFGQYLELDIPYCLVAHFARTLNRSFFDEAEVCVRQLMDVPAHGGGYGHQHGESSHYYTTGATFFYFLTGLDFVKESIRTSHDDYAKVAPWHMRSFGITMWSNLDMLRLFGDEQYMDNIKKALKWFADAQDPATGFRDYGQKNFQEFMLGMGMDSLGRYCLEFPHDQEMRDRLVALSIATMGTHGRGERAISEKGKDEPWKQNNSCCNAHTYAYLFTGRDKHLDFASELLDASLLSARPTWTEKTNDPLWPVYRTGTGSGKFWSEFGHRDSQTHMAVRKIRTDNGTPKPPTAIHDLAATIEGDKVTLSWTAPAGATAHGGNAEKYFVKLAAKPIQDDVGTREAGASAANWWMTPLVKEAPPAPAKAGEKQAMTVVVPPALAKGGLYVAVRSARQVGLVTAVSDLSNVVEVRPK